MIVCKIAYVLNGRSPFDKLSSTHTKSLTPSATYNYSNMGGFMGVGAVQGTCFNNRMIFISMEIMINPDFRHPLDSLELVFDYDVHRKWLSVEMIDGCG